VISIASPASNTNFRFFRNLSLNGFFARSESPGVTTNQDSARRRSAGKTAQALQASIMKIGEGFATISASCAAPA
jgi:hypothetical protein